MNKKGSWDMFLLIAFIVVAAALLVYGLAYAFTAGAETITIKDKWAKYDGDDAKYLVSSEDGQVFEITDSLFKWRFDSSNLYATLDEGETYRIKTQGWRLGIMSDYKNILEVELIT